MSQRNFLPIAVIAAALLSGCGDKSNAPQKEVTPKMKEPITFKGIPFDKAGSMDALRKLCLEDEANKGNSYLLGLCSKEGFDGLYGRKQAMMKFTYGNIQEVGFFSFGEKINELSAVEINASKQEILALAEILEVKYGKPDKIKSIVENGMGTKFEKNTFVWMDEKGNRIIVDSMHQKIDEGRILIESAVQIAMLAFAEKKQKEAAKSSL